MSGDFNPAPTASPDRLVRLDGLRGLAALGVALHHAFFHFANWPFADALLTSPLAATARWIQLWGWTLVDLFFVLSGYVFAHVYLRGSALSTRSGLADFALARFARLYPLHLVMLLLIALFAFGKGANTPFAFVANLLMAQAFIIPFAASFDQPAWSLSVECLCYLLFALAAFAGRSALLWASAVAALWGAAMLVTHGLPGGPWVQDAVPRGFLGFFLGQALWHGRGWLTRIPAPFLALGTAAGFFFQSGGYSPLLPLTLLAWPSALLLCLKSQAMGGRVMVWLGDRSYGIYLVNLPIVMTAVALVDRSALSPWATAAWQAALVALTLLASEAAYRLIECPARRAIRTAWLRRRTAGAQAVPA
ncbi:MAG: acyltransferase [Novosphingobium sp.]